MDSNVLESYLVKLGFSVDGAGVARFQGALRNTSRSVESMIGATAGKLLNWGTATTGVFIGLGAGIAGVIDKVAMADQSYRLFALRMFTTQAVGRELSITMKALGASLDQIVWDPELHARAMQLFKDQEIMTAGMGKEFEQNMIGIRNLRFEFQRLGVIMQYGSFAFVSDLFKDFFPQFGEMTKSFHGFNDWLRDNLPQVMETAAKKVHDFLTEMYDDWIKVKNAATEVGTAIVQSIGILTGDQKLKGATLSIDSITEAVKDLAGGIKSLMDSLGASGLLKGGMPSLPTLPSSLGHVIQGATDWKKGDKLGALKEFFYAEEGDENAKKEIAPIQKIIKPIHDFLYPDREKVVKNAIAAVSKSFGLDPSIALAVASYESGYRQFDKSGKPLMSDKLGSHATGMFQLQPDTAKMLGVDPTKEESNIYGGVKYLTMLMKQYGTEEKALEHYYGSKDPAQNKAYAQGVMATQVHIDKVIIQSAPNLTPQQHAKAIKDGMQFETQKKLAQTGGGTYQ